MRRTKEFAAVVREFADRGEQWLLESPENARGLLLAMAGDFASRLDFGRIQHLPTRFIPDNLRKHEADILFRLPYRPEGQDTPQDVFIYILIEHQSATDPAMGFRLLVYMVNIWDRQRRQWLDQKFPVSEWRFLPIIPIVFYTGSQKWETPISMDALMELPRELKRFIPQFETLLLKLKEASPEELTASGHPFGWLLRVMQQEKASEQDLQQAIEQAIEYLAELADEEREAWEKAIYYLYLLVHHRRKPREGERLQVKIHEGIAAARGRKVATTMAATLAEELIEKGEKKGALRAKQDDLLHLMAGKFGSVPQEIPKRVRRIRDTETLDRLLIQVLHAGSVDEMGLS